MQIVFYIELLQFLMHRKNLSNSSRGRFGRDRMVVGFITTYAISAYHH